LEIRVLREPLGGFVKKKRRGGCLCSHMFLHCWILDISQVDYIAFSQCPKFLELFKDMVLIIQEYTQVFLEKSSMKVKTYLAPSSEGRLVQQTSL